MTVGYAIKIKIDFNMPVEYGWSSENKNEVNEVTLKSDTEFKTCDKQF